MMEKTLHFQIVTAGGSVCDTAAEFVLVPTSGGEIGILPGHTAIIGAVTEGVVKYKAEESEHYVAVSGGVLSVADDEIIILARSAEKAESIDIARAQASEKRARQRLEAKSEKLDALRAELSLHRALAREKAYSMIHK